MTNPKASPRVMREAREGDRDGAHGPRRLTRTLSTTSSAQEPSGFWGALFDFAGFTNSLRVRKDWKLKEKLYMSVGGDYCFQSYQLKPVLMLTYKFSSKLQLMVTPNTIKIERPVTVQLSGFGLDITPTLKINMKQSAAPLKLDTKFESLRPAHLVAGVIGVGVLLGIPLKTTKVVQVPKLSNIAKDYSRLDCQARFGVRRSPVSGLTLMVNEINGILRVGPPPE